ncbi:hypothetical protein CAEBREN_08893 [Caenorhabditis brenneri]|uniref:Calponin-homology (CH) domain-containing protein n=1 Tax=Caenorhabditis brenneri TaxID=135651 RepID=G0NKF3_CAEBE|nr:hypothetical protein CAEBREN_08893 [Caenorhabditis brenneri]
MSLTSEQWKELADRFKTIRLTTQEGHLERKEIQEAYKILGLDIPTYELRPLLDRAFGAKEIMDVKDVVQLYVKIREEKTEVTKNWKVKSVTGTYKTKSAKQDAVQHTIRFEEEVAFVDFINKQLKEDEQLMHLLPVQHPSQLYSELQDGLILCKLINLTVPGTIDERAINTGEMHVFKRMENLTLALKSAQSIGVNIVNIDSKDLFDGTAHLVLGIIWQLIRIKLFNQINLQHCPGLFRLLRDSESLEDLHKMSPEEILLRWVNYHLAGSESERTMINFTSDVADSEVYTHLLYQIAAPEHGVTLEPLNTRDVLERADRMLKEAEKLDSREFISAQDVVGGNHKLNMAFVANLFNKHPNLPGPDPEVEETVEEIPETREEKTYRNWINSMGVDPYVSWIYNDLQDGLVLLQLFNAIQPGVVDSKKVITKFRNIGGMLAKIQNCNYAVELGKQMGFSLVGVQGKDIVDGNRTLTLALLWQLMRAYTLSVLGKCTRDGDVPTDKDILKWANEKLRSSGKSSSIHSFHDPKISNATVILELIEAIKPGVIDIELIKDDDSEGGKLKSAKYAINCGRKIGAAIYALPEDIVEVNPKMVMTVLACLMAQDCKMKAST